MSRAGSRALPTAIAAAAIAASTLLIAPSCYVPAVDRRAALGAVAAAAAIGVQQQPAEAAQATFSVFGFGVGSGGVSDAYAQIDADAISPYSQFGDPTKSEFANNPEIREKIYKRQKAKVVDSIKGLDRVPQLIQTKQSENLKSLLTAKMYMLRDAMEYVTLKGPSYTAAPGGTPFKKTDAFSKADAPGLKEARAFFQDIADLGVAGRTANWAWASEAYEQSKADFAAWKNIVGEL